MKTGTSLPVATAVAILLACQPAWGHTFPPVRTVVVQVERCEVAVLVGYRVASGAATEQVLRKAASAPKSQVLETLRELLTRQALGPLAFGVDGHRLVPTAVRAKLSMEPGQTQPSVVALVTFPLPAGKTLSVTTADPRTTRISWADRASGRVQISDAPAQGQWFVGVASMLLSLVPNSGGSACAPSPTLP